MCYVKRRHSSLSLLNNGEMIEFNKNYYFENDGFLPIVHVENNSYVGLFRFYPNTECWKFHSFCIVHALKIDGIGNNQLYSLPRRIRWQFTDKIFTFSKHNAIKFQLSWMRKIYVFVIMKYVLFLAQNIVYFHITYGSKYSNPKGY